jgi:ketosteroid isomerase-like protein
MKGMILFGCFIILSHTVSAQSANQPPASTAAPSAPSRSSDESSIRMLMADQAAAWNRGSIDDFMKGYWNNDSLMFIGTSGITYGYKTTLANYKKRYDTPDKMGQLFFTLLKVQRISPDHYFVIGKWLVKRKIGDIGGVYTLLFRKINGHWHIVADHTS